MDYYVYKLESINHPDKYYIGFSTDVNNRLIKHNEGGDKYSSKYRLWKVKNTISFDEKAKALAFEKYLKRLSGRVFAKE
jgi:predicted GIY-YIG superfamily endonuclease